MQNDCPELERCLADPGTPSLEPLARTGGVWVQAPPSPPSCCGPTEDELTRAALEDPAALDTGVEDGPPTVWRVVTLIVFAVVALGIVFTRRW